MSVAAGLILAGGGLAAASTIQQGRIAEAQGEAQDEIKRYQAEQVRRQGEARLSAAKIEATRVSRKERIVSAMNIARSAKSGISLSESPSTIEAMADVAYQFHLDRNLITQGGMQDFLSAEGQSSLLRAEGAFAKEQGKAAKRLSYLTAASQMMMAGGAAGAASTPAPQSTGTPTTFSSGAQTTGQYSQGQLYGNSLMR
ncbi:MAG: hypothetical protein ACYTFK_14660 [Planctomycetota bacterium]|jgi:hypothetical protein